MTHSNERELRFKAMVERNRDTIWHVCNDYTTGLNKAWEVEDAFQEVLYTIWRDLDTYKGKSSEKTWCYRVATTTMLMLRRQSRNQQHVEVAFTTEQAEVPSDNYTLLLQLIDNLDDKDTMIVKAHLDGYRLHEIAAMVGLSQAATTMRLSRAKRKLKKQYRETV